MPFKVIIDACVVYPATVRDVLLSAAYEGLYQLYWTDEILDEAFRNLIADGRITKDAAARTSATMRRAFPESTVTDFEDLIPAMRNEPKDRHVVAAAVKAGAQVIVTANLPDFQDLPSGIEAQTPDNPTRAGGSNRPRARIAHSRSSEVRVSRRPATACTVYPSTSSSRCRGDDLSSLRVRDAQI